MHVESEADEAVRCLSSENFKLKQKMRELESVSKDQSELLLEVLPKYDALEHQVKMHDIEKAYLERKLEGIEAENAELISDWNLVEIKMQNLEGENQALKEENGILKSARDILAKRLVKITMRNITSSKDGDNIDGSTSNKSMKRRRVMDDMHSDANRTPQNLLNTNHSNKKTVVLKRRKKRTRESIAREYEMEKRKLKHMLAEATNETDKLKKRVEKLKRRVNKERRTRVLSI
jgi:chromosome segregation ATPase